MFYYALQFAVVGGLFILFRLGFENGWLAKMPGPAWIEHGHLILLLLIPYFHWSVVIIWVFGIIAYIDDAYQHRRRTWDANYRSPLHMFAWYTLRFDKLFSWLGIGG